MVFSPFNIIAGGLLLNCNSLEENINIPSSVKEISSFAFSGNSRVKTIRIPDTVVKIGEHAFSGCRNLEKVIFEGDIPEMGNGVFRNCPKMAGEEGYHIFGDVLCGCYGVKEINIPEEVKVIGSGAFRLDDIEEIRLPDHIVEIHDEGLAECFDLKRVYIPNSVKRVGKRLFAGSDKLEYINIPDISLLTPKYKELAFRSFISDGVEAGDPRCASYGKYISKNALKLLNEAMADVRLLTFMCDNGLIPVKDADAYFNAALETGDVETMAIMINYRGMTVGESEMKRHNQNMMKMEHEVFDRIIARGKRKDIVGLNVAYDIRNIREFENIRVPEMIKALGGIPKKTINSKIDYLIIRNNDSATAKRVQAAELGIMTMTEEALSMLVKETFEIDSDRLIRYKGEMEVLHIPEGIREIKGQAFCGCDCLREIFLPKSVQKIEISAFGEAPEHRTVHMSSDVSTISKFAFLPPANYTIRAPLGSCAHRYARENGIKFIPED